MYGKLFICILSSTLDDAHYITNLIQFSFLCIIIMKIYIKGVSHECKKIAKELDIKEYQVETPSFIDEGNTIPFIARYRKEAHGSLDDTNLEN